MALARLLRSLFLAPAPCSANRSAKRFAKRFAATSALPSAVLLALLIGSLAPAPVAAQGPAPVPSPSDVLGYDIGDRFPFTAEVERYFEALAQRSPLLSMDPYGVTPEGRPLLQAVVARAEFRSDLEGILARNAELLNPNTSEARAREIAATNPAVLYFTYGIHGNESSSPSAAMWTAWDLVRGDPSVAGVLDSVIVIMDPVANPDGYDRYVSHWRSTSLIRANTNPGLRERREGWPGGRVNHYLFDLNRDWAWLTQSESRDRAARWQRWNPQVHVDFHEMGFQSSYFFFPAAKPINDIFPPFILDWGRRFGEGNAAALDEEGLLYYTGQNFDLFYPGYGDSWPSLVGAIGMTYEQGGGGSASRQIERSDGTLLTLRDRAFGHRTTGHATLQTAARGKTDLLLGFAGYHRTVDEGLEDIFLVPGDDEGRSEALLGLLLRHAIEVERLTTPVRIEATPHPGFESRSTFPAGTLRVRARQPRGRLAGALLRPDNVLEGSASYDITAWALPFAYGVEAHSASRPASGDWARVNETRDPYGARLAGSGSYGYLMAPSVFHAPAMIQFLEAGGRAIVMADTFSTATQAWPQGTVFFPQGRNDGLDARLEAAGLGGVVTPITTGFSAGGIDLGTNDARPIRLPRVVLLGGEGTNANAFGAHWHFLEQVLDLPFDAVNVADLGGVNLAEIDVILVPPGNPVGTLGDAGLERLRTWIRGGGTLVASGQAAQRLAGPLAEVEERGRLDRSEPSRDDRLDRALRTREERAEAQWEDRIPGTILSATLDAGHPLSFGAGAGGGQANRIFVLSSGVGFEPLDRHESVAFFPQGLDRISGVISGGNLERLDRSAWLVQRSLGSGKVILFADDPIFRGFWVSAWPMYVNAILLAPYF